MLLCEKIIRGKNMLFIWYPKCSTCQKAKMWLDNNGIEYQRRDIKIDNPTRDELLQWHKKSGADIKKFFNTSGLIYKSMNLKEKLPQMSLEEKIELLSGDGMLVKRPIIVCDDFVLIGFKEKEWNSAFGK